MADDQPPGSSLGGFEGEVIRNYATRSTVHDMLKPVERKIDHHLGYHEGQKITWAIVVPLLAAAMSATAILVAAFAV